jgi:glutamyl-tRNA reductase
MELCCLGMNHRTAPLAVREQFAVGSDEVPEVLALLLEQDALAEAFVLSTCNRFEIYAVRTPGSTVEAAVRAIGETMCAKKGVHYEVWERHAYRHIGVGALTHLFRVASSLDSMVLGEPQILGQVKDAWSVARDAGTLGSLLHRTMDRAFRTAKKVRNETGIAEGAISISWVAVQLARRIFADMSKCTVLLLGAGEMAELAAVHLAEQGASSVVVANRTPSRAEALATKRGWDWAPMDDLPGLLADADIVIGSTGSRLPVIVPSVVRAVLKKRHYRPLFLIDIAVPRDVDPAVAQLDGVYLYNVDDMEEIAERNRQKRVEEAHHAEEMVADEAKKFADWVASQAIAPTVASLRQKLMEIRDTEMARSAKAFRDMTPEQIAAVERMTQSMANRFLHDPIIALKKRGGAAEGAQLAYVLRELFGLRDLALLQADPDDDDDDASGSAELGKREG